MALREIGREIAKALEPARVIEKGFDRSENQEIGENRENHGEEER